MTPVKKVALALVAVSALSLGIGYASANFIKSPAQVTAESEPPEPTELTAPVESGTVNVSNFFAGSVALGNTVAVSPSPPEGIDAVVTKVPLAVGNGVGPGSVLLEIADRPVLLLGGDVPLLRDLARGDTGADVRRLQDSLRAAGWNVNDAAGTFGSSTSQALIRFYNAAGFKAPLDASGSARALRSELVFAPNGASGRVVEVKAVLGAVVENPVLTLTTAPSVVTADLTQADLANVAVGGRVSVAGTGIATEGAIASVGPLIEVEGVGFRSRVTIATDVELPVESIGSDVQVTTTANEFAETGLLIPLAALRSDTDGATSVIVVDGEEQTRVAVQVLETGSGRARVSAAEGELAEGDLVLIGES